MKLYAYALSASEVSDLYNIDVDGDGYAAWEDCDDNDASVGSSANDADCDGVSTANDCDDNDPSLSTCTVFSSGIEHTCILDIHNELQCWEEIIMVRVVHHLVSFAVFTMVSFTVVPLTLPIKRLVGGWKWKLMVPLWSK